jgi:hypothetical protein
MATSATGNATVMCPAGTFAVGGGYADSSSAGADNIMFNRPIGSPATGWQATANNARTITVYAVCTP